MSIQKCLLMAASALTILSATISRAQVVYKTDFSKEANMKIYVTNYKQEADVVVFKTPFIHNADGNDGIWYFTPYEGEARKTVCFTPAKQTADLVVFSTSKKEEAGWINKKEEISDEVSRES